MPGAPKAVSCAATSDVIPDEWDRAWKITTIDFRNRDGYERVVLNLERTGRNRTKWPTQAQIERMPNSQVKKALEY